jgi:hypothetical protein
MLWRRSRSWAPPVAARRAVPASSWSPAGPPGRRHPPFERWRTGRRVRLVLGGARPGGHPYRRRARMQSTCCSGGGPAETATHRVVVPAARVARSDPVRAPVDEDAGAVHVLGETRPRPSRGGGGARRDRGVDFIRPSTPTLERPWHCQVRECSAASRGSARERHLLVVVVGHVTKGGTLAPRPRAIRHGGSPGRGHARLPVAPHHHIRFARWTSQRTR